MPWKDVSAMSQREEFVLLVSQPEANVQALCRRFGVSRPTGYKWLARYRASGRDGLRDQSRRPRGSPRRTESALESAVLAVRLAHRAWGGRKIRTVLQSQADRGVLRDDAGVMLHRDAVPSASTITAILRRHGKLDANESLKHQPWQRFEHAAPNDLWQMDFKGHFALATGGRCHPLTVLDDHSRFAIGLRACGDETAMTVQRELILLFRQYGLPRRMLMDNGAPWGDRGDQPWTIFTAWLLRLDIGVSHGRPYHPQTQGKDERFHRTLNVELLRENIFNDLPGSQERFDPWRDDYNCLRPHEALSMAVPASRYQPSARSMPEVLPAIEYSPGDQVRRVQQGGWISFRGRACRVGSAFVGQPVALRATTTDGLLEVYYCRQRIGEVDLRRTGERADGVTPRGQLPFAAVAALPPLTPADHAAGTVSSNDNPGVKDVSEHL